MSGFIGYEDIIRNFNLRVDKGTLSHAHLIVGVEGIGKSILARKFALKILGKNQEREYIDLITYSPKKASIGVDEVREIIEEVSKKPYEGDKKVIIIKGGNKLTVQAQNALLKTIEEPPKGVYIILLTDSLELMLDTIISRCQVYKLYPLSKKEMEDYVNTLGDFSKEDKLSAIAYGEGIPWRSQRFLTDTKLSSLRECIINLLEDISTGSFNEILEYEKKLESYKDNKDEIMNILEGFIRDIILYKEVNNVDLLINRDKIEQIGIIAQNNSYKRFNKMLDTIRDGRKNILRNASFAMVISIMLIGLSEG